MDWIWVVREGKVSVMAWGMCSNEYEARTDMGEICSNVSDSDA